MFLRKMCHIQSFEQNKQLDFVMKEQHDGFNLCPLIGTVIDVTSHNNVLSPSSPELIFTYFLSRNNLQGF